MRWLAGVTWLLAGLAWSPSSRAQAAACPRAAGSWIQLIFSGTSWSPALEAGVLRELRIELLRRSLDVCAGPEQSSALPPQKVITLLAADRERVSVVVGSIAQEGSFEGRTILIGTIAEDARALAIAQAVDEALRAESGEPPPTPPAPAPSAPAPEKPPEAPASSWFVGAAVAPALQLAPASSGRTHALVAPGATLRLSAARASIGGSLGVTITRASDLSFGVAAIRDFRLPADLSLDLRLARGPAQALLELGVLVAFASYGHASSGDAQSTVELGGRAGLRLGWGYRVMPWVGTSIEVVPRTTELRFTPTGSFGRTPAIWLGFALGTEVRWP